jgi:hypothetical protein
MKLERNPSAANLILSTPRALDTKENLHTGKNHEREAAFIPFHLFSSTIYENAENRVLAAA